MPFTSRLFPGDEELGKRDDDHRPGSSHISTAWKHRRGHGLSFPPRNLKRFSLTFIGLIVLYYFFKWMPTDNQRPMLRPHYVHAGDPNAPPSAKETTTPAQDPETTEHDIHYFNGPIKFYKLATSLHAAQSDGLGSSLDTNVLFAASSLRSASTLIPLACEMAFWGRNNVHFTLMGRDPIKIDLLKSVNGVDKQCAVTFHDARPDYSVESSDFRMEVSAGAGLNHINNFLHPQAVIIDSSEQEDEFFLKALRAKAPALGKTLIELPAETENLLWITRLDSGSLNAWNQVSVDIVIHAPPDSSGALIRLLKTLEQADYFNSPPPRITIELPQKIEAATSSFLEQFKWPPHPTPGQPSSNQLNLHHRIPQHRASEEENAIRFVESFWPTNPMTSHVLVMSAQAEVSPLFFHYLKYAVLEYRYSRENIRNGATLFGISLEIPSAYLNDTTAFVPPVTKVDKTEVIDDFTPFLWGAPNSNAMLVFGDRWVELHSYTSHLLASRHLLPTPPTLNKKLVSKTFPVWLEHMLELSRLRGYLTLYPNGEMTNTFVTVHNEMYQIPEEYLKTQTDESFSITPTEDFTADPETYLSLTHTEAPLVKGSLTSLLPRDRLLPSLRSLTLLSWDGILETKVDIDVDAAEYMEAFQREVGGCTAASPLKQRLHNSAADLFCLDEVAANQDIANAAADTTAQAAIPKSDPDAAAKMAVAAVYAESQVGSLPAAGADALSTPVIAAKDP